MGGYILEKFFLKFFNKKEKMMYFKHTNRKNLIMQMKKGYIEMGELNLQMAEEGICADNEALFIAEHNGEWHLRCISIKDIY